MATKFNPAGATREMFAKAITRAMNDMTDDEINGTFQILERALSALSADMTMKVGMTEFAALEARVTALEERCAALEGGDSNA